MLTLATCDGGGWVRVCCGLYRSPKCDDLEDLKSLKVT